MLNQIILYICLRIQRIQEFMIKSNNPQTPSTLPAQSPKEITFIFFYYQTFEILWSSNLISHFSNIRYCLLISYCDETQFHSPTLLSTNFSIDSVNFIANFKWLLLLTYWLTAYVNDLLILHFYCINRVV